MTSAQAPQPAQPAPLDLAPFKLPMQPIPDRAQAALARGVGRADFPAWTEAGRVLADGANCAEGVQRAPDGRMRVVCRTELPGVSPQMIDWWFGWHMRASARYQLWHPLAHLWTEALHDRSQCADDRARYVGNVSLVDEYIGPTLCRLAIAFQPPASCGLSDAFLAGATAVCALTTDRQLRLQAGGLVHWVVPTAQGAQMRSVFWLGEVACRWPLLGPAAQALLNTRWLRQKAVTDHFALDL